MCIWAVSVLFSLPQFYMGQISEATDHQCYINWTLMQHKMHIPVPYRKYTPAVTPQQTRETPLVANSYQKSLFPQGTTVELFSKIDFFPRSETNCSNTSVNQKLESKNIHKYQPRSQYNKRIKQMKQNFNLNF